MLRLSALALALLALPACSGGEDDPAGAATPGAPVVYDEAEVVDYLGLEVRPEDDFPPEFEISTSMYADYRWAADDGTVCFISGVETSAEEAADSDVTNPDKTAGVSFYADMDNRATCSMLLADALADFG